MPPSNRPPCRPSPLLPRTPVRAAALVRCASALLGRLLERAGTNGASRPGRLARARRGIGRDDADRLGWQRRQGQPDQLPKGETTWVAPGRAGVLAATLADGTTPQRPTPSRQDARVASGQARSARPATRTAGPDYVRDLGSGRRSLCTLAGDVATGDGVRVVLIDPSVSTAFEIPLDRSVVAAPPAWIDSDRLVIVTGDPPSAGRDDRRHDDR